jgi:hypothetical protein
MTKATQSNTLPHVGMICNPTGKPLGVGGELRARRPHRAL